MNSTAPKIGLSYTGPARRAARVGSGREWIINDRTPDRHGTIIEPGGARLENYRANPVVLFNHDHARIVGTSTVRRDGSRLVATVDRWAEDAAGVRQKVGAGILRAASVGFRVLNRERGTGPDGKPVTRITDWELVEWSICAVGSNPSALKRSGEVGRLPEHAVRKLRAEGQGRPGGSKEIMLTDAQVGRLLRGELRADVETSRRAGVCVEEGELRGGKTGTLRGAEARRSMYAARYRLKPVQLPPGSGSRATFRRGRQ